MVELDVTQIMATAASMVMVIGGIAAAVIAIRKWIQRLAASAGRAEKQLATSNGHTVGQYVEATHSVVSRLRDEFRSELGSLARIATSNQDAAKLAAEAASRAEKLAQLTAERLDAHVASHHPTESS